MTDLPTFPADTPIAHGAAPVPQSTVVTLPPNPDRSRAVPPQALQPGDLLFTPTAPGHPGRIAIYMGNGTAIEATEGVVSFALEDALAGQSGIVAWRHHAMTPAAADTMVRWLRTQEGRPYPAVDIPAISFGNDEVWICPDLIAAAFTHINLPIFDPGAVLPGQPVLLQTLGVVGHIQQGVSPTMTYDRPLGPFTPDETDRDAMIPAGSYGQSIDASLLEVGDLIVVSADHPLSEAIRQRTNSPASHVALYVGDGFVVEAIATGVERRRLATTLSETVYAAAYRYTGLSPTEKAQIKSFALSEWRRGAEYDYLAIASLQRTQDDDAWFCSELVFAAYASAGIRLGDAQQSNPGQVINLQGVEYLGHLPAQGDSSETLARPRARRHDAARAGAMNGPSLAALGFEVLKGVVTGSAGDITYNFDQLRGKYSVQWPRWSSQERLDHDAPAYPYTTASLESRQSHWDAGTISATIPFSFDYNGHFISNLRLSRPLTDEHFGYSMDLSGEISENRNYWRNSSGDRVSRVDLRITHVIDYDFLGESFFDDTAEIVERYEIYSDGSVWCTVVVSGTMFFGVGDARPPYSIQNGALHIEGIHSAVVDAILRTRTSQAQSRTNARANLEISGGQSVHWESAPFRVRGTGEQPRQDRDPGALVASVPQSRTDSQIDRAVQAAIRHGATRDEAETFFAHEAALSRRGARTLSGTASFPSISVVAADGWIASLLEEIAQLAFPSQSNALQQLFDFCTRQNLSIGLGITLGAGFVVAGDVGFGIVIAPGNRIGYYGSLSAGIGWNFEVSVGIQLTVIEGGPNVFAGTSIVIGGNVDVSEGLGIGARMLLDMNGRPIGLTGELTFSLGVPGVSAVEVTAAAQFTHAQFIQVRSQGLALGLSAERMIGGLPLRTAPANGAIAPASMGWRQRAQNRPASPKRIWA